MVKLTFWGLKIILYFLLLPDILSALTISVDKNHANSAKAAYPPELAQLLLSDEVQGPTPHRTRNTSGREKKTLGMGPICQGCGPAESTSSSPLNTGSPEH